MRGLQGKKSTLHREDWAPVVQVNTETFYSYKFENWDSWIRYYWAISTIFENRIENVLEVGIGTRVINSYLRRNGLRVTSLDIDPGLEPDAVGSVTDIPFEDHSFEAVICMEVLEHMPYEYTERAIREIHRVSRRYALITTPHYALSFALLLRLPILQLRELRVRLPLPRPLKSTRYHAWECGRPGYPVSRLRRSLRDAGFHILSERRPPTNYSNCFFFLEKEGG